MLDQVKVKELAQTSDTTKTVFNALAKRERFRSSTDLAKFHRALLGEGARIVPVEFLELFKRLHDMKVGTLVFGRRGKPNRFIWNYNFKEVAKAATSDMSPKNIKPLAIPKAKEDNAPEALLERNMIVLKVVATPELIAVLTKLIGFKVEGGS
jgi:hypothetical protein